MHEELNKAKQTEHQLKSLNDLKFGVFNFKKPKKTRHYSLDKIKAELYEVYKYKNELEESRNVDAISKKLRSIIRGTEKFWGKEIYKRAENSVFEGTNKQSIRGFSTGESTKSEGRGVIYTKNFVKVTLEPNNM